MDQGYQIEERDWSSARVDIFVVEIGILKNDITIHFNERRLVCCRTVTFDVAEIIEPRAQILRPCKLAKA